MNLPRGRTSFAFLLLTVLLVPLLAACGGTPSTQNGATTGPAATTGGAATGATTGTSATTTGATTAATAGGATGATAAATTGTGATAAATTGAGATQTATTGATAGTTATTAAAGATTTGAVAPSTVSGKVLRVQQPVWPDTLDPQKASFSNEIGVLILNYEGLTRYDKDLKTVPAAAESWQYNKDDTQITFKLRPGLKYSDGSPLVAQDFVNAVYRTLDPRNPGDYQTSLNMIKGANAVINTAVPTDTAKLPGLFKALGVSAPDERTITFQLTQPTPYFHTLAGIWVMYPAKQSSVDKGGATWWENGALQVGNGPFQITKIDKSSNVIEFKANQNYWQGKPKLDGVLYRYITDLSVGLQAYKRGEIDIAVPDPNDVPTVKADAQLGKEYKEYPGACTFTLIMNLNKPPFNNKLVRQAFAYALDRDSYIRDALKGTEIKTLTWIPPGYPGYDPTENRFGFNPDKAKQLLAQAGFPNGQGLPPIKYSYGSGNPATATRVQFLAQVFQQYLGVTLTPDPVENTTLTRMRKTNATYPQMSGGGWCADYPDPQDWLSIYWQSSTDFAKTSGYKNADADKLMNQADVETNPTKRMQLYQQAQKLIIGDQGEIMLGNSKNYYLIKPNVTGFDFTPQDSDTPGQMTGLMNVTIK